MKWGKHFLKLLAAATLIGGILGGGSYVLKADQPFAKAQEAQAEGKKGISIEAFAKKLEKAAGLKIGTLIQEGEFADTKAMITWTQAAVLTNRADERKNGTDYDKELYEKVIDGKRLTGLKELKEEEKRAARLCFVKGMILGSSKGSYSQSRAFHGTDRVTVSEAHTILERLKNPEKRRKLSPDGRLLRTTRLPKNYKKFDYILEDFPNEFYERRFAYQMYHEPLSSEDYTCPKNMKKIVYKDGDTFLQMYEQYGDIWMQTIRTNLECRFHFDYRTVDNEWISKLAGTYIYDSGEAKWNKRVKDCIKNYVETAKENHVVIKADKIIVEPSTLYYCLGNYYVRCYIRFKINADTVYPAKEGETNRQHEMIFSGYECVVLENLKRNQWYEMSIDVPIRQTMGNQNPATYSIGLDQIWPWK